MLYLFLWEHIKTLVYDIAFDIAEELVAHIEVTPEEDSDIPLILQNLQNSTCLRFQACAIQLVNETSNIVFDPC